MVFCYEEDNNGLTTKKRITIVYHYEVDNNWMILDVMRIHSFSLFEKKSLSTLFKSSTRFYSQFQRGINKLQ